MKLLLPRSRVVRRTNGEKSKVERLPAKWLTRKINVVRLVQFPRDEGRNPVKLLM